MSVQSVAKKMVELNDIAARHGGWERRDGLYERYFSRHGSVLAFIHNDNYGFCHATKVIEVIGMHASVPFTNDRRPLRQLALKGDEFLLRVELGPNRDCSYYTYKAVPQKIKDLLTREIEGSGTHGKQGQESGMCLFFRRMLNRVENCI
ncbi:MAG: hypothetical protein NTX79_08750 [Candidatus Micrarchaeota archaeon]|nr:hypothetical protein [Candidatus Micrarchaeota archaeon]